MSPAGPEQAADCPKQSRATINAGMAASTHWCITNTCTAGRDHIAPRQTIFPALHPVGISYSIAPRSWEVRGFQNTASTL